MANEIERKFLIKRMPDLSNLKSVIYERYYIYRDAVVEMRVQKKGERYEIERKQKINELKSEKSKMEISESEFEALKKFGGEIITREGFFISSNPNVSIKIYHGKYEGLKKVEVEFDSELEANNFQIPDWYGQEITNSIVSRDSKLLDLNSEQFRDFIEKTNN